MSRSYAIRIPIEVLLSETLRNRLAGFKLNFPLLEILSPERMRELVRSALLEAGFTEAPGGGLSMPAGFKQSAIIDPATMEMILSLDIPAEHLVRMEEESIPGMEHLIKNALARGTTIDNGSINDLSEKMAREMANLAVKAQTTVNGVLKDVYREAIREKAGQIGTVSNISESSDGNIYRIHIEIDQ